MLVTVGVGAGVIGIIGAIAGVTASESGQPH
jgi:hypothetical protein